MCQSWKNSLETNKDHKTWIYNLLLWDKVSELFFYETAFLCLIIFYDKTRMTYLVAIGMYICNISQQLGKQPREEPHQKSKSNPDIYSKTRLQIIRWNKSRETSTENEEKQKGLNVGKRTTWYDRSLTTIILYSIYSDTKL